MRLADARKIINRALKNRKDPNENIALIINIGNHFVTVIVNDYSVQYFDSFALPITDTKIRSFLEYLLLPPTPLPNRDARKKLFFANKKQIQDYTSTHCGLYAVLFAVWYIKPASKRFTLRFSNDVNLLMRNDKLCLKYLKQFID